MAEILGGTHHGADFVNNSHLIVIGGGTQMATQQKLGLWAKRWDWPDLDHSFDTSTDESVLD